MNHLFFVSHCSEILGVWLVTLCMNIKCWKWTQVEINWNMGYIFSLLKRWVISFRFWKDRLYLFTFHFWKDMIYIFTFKKMGYIFSLFTFVKDRLYLFTFPFGRVAASKAGRLSTDFPSASIRPPTPILIQKIFNTDKDMKYW